jgi:hypothetical protein
MKEILKYVVKNVWHSLLVGLGVLSAVNAIDDYRKERDSDDYRKERDSDDLEF